MKVDIVKLKLKKFADDLIDIIFPLNQIFDKIKNATARYWIDQNIYRVDTILKSFADQNDELDIDVLVSLYEDTLFEDGKLKLDIKKLIPEDMDYIRSIFPDKIIVFDKSDFENIFK